MRVIVVHKTSNYELHGQRTEEYVRGGVIGPDSLARLKKAHEEHYQTLAVLYQLLSEHGVSFVTASRGDEWSLPSESFDYTITVGGDGTLLAASHLLPQGGRVVGLRSSHSSVGALCAYDFRHMQRFCQDLVSGSLGFISVPRLRAEVIRAADGAIVRTMPVLNDFLYANVSPAATTRYRIAFNDQTEAQKSSGVWVSTPIGSTAATRAAGGQVLELDSEFCQFITRELFFPPNTSFELRGGLFKPGQDRLEIENRTEHALLALDGQHGELALGFGDKLRFLAAPTLQLGQRPKEFGGHWS